MSPALVAAAKRENEAARKNWDEGVKRHNPATHKAGPGRPPAPICTDTVRKLRAEGMPWKQIATLLGCSEWTLHLRLRKERT